MGTYLYALKAPSKSVKALDKTAGDTKLIGVMEFIVKVSFDIDTNYRNYVNRRVGPKERAWASVGEAPTLFVWDGSLEELKAGKVTSVPVLHNPTGAVSIHDGGIIKTVGYLYNVNGIIEFESL
jgi:hypothetical protein